MVSLREKLEKNYSKSRKMLGQILPSYFNGNNASPPTFSAIFAYEIKITCSKKINKHLICAVKYGGALLDDVRALHMSGTEVVYDESPPSFTNKHTNQLLF